MGIRNSEELGENLFKIAKYLLTNERLCQLLVNTDLNPFDTIIEDTSKLLHNNIRIVPKVDEKEFKNDSKIVLFYPKGDCDKDNTEFKNIIFKVTIYTPLTSWIINDINLRPFLIMSEIEKSLKGKRINGIGRLEYDGFEISLLTDKLSGYEMMFYINVFD